MLYKTLKKKAVGYVYEDHGLLGCYAPWMYFSRYPPAFWRNMLPHLQVRRIKMEAGSFSSILVNLCQNIQCHILEN